MQRLQRRPQYQRQFDLFGAQSRQHPQRPRTIGLRQRPIQLRHIKVRTVGGTGEHRGRIDAAVDGEQRQLGEFLRSGQQIALGAFGQQRQRVRFDLQIERAGTRLQPFRERGARNRPDGYRGALLLPRRAPTRCWQPPDRGAR